MFDSPVLLVLVALVTAVFLFKRFTSSPRSQPVEPEVDLHLPGKMQAILDAARWAPSGDNEQKWRFQVVSAEHVRVHTTHAQTIYDMDAGCHHISVGAMIETLVIAASQFGYRVEYKRDKSLDTSDLQGVPTKNVWDVRLIADPAVKPSHLFADITKRATQRQHMKTRRITPKEKQALELALGPDYTVAYVESFCEKLSMASLTYNISKWRMTMPESTEAHADMVDFKNEFTRAGIPSQSLCLDNGSLRVMEWAMSGPDRWQRMCLLNKYAGPGPSCFQMDYLPALACGAHAILRSRKKLETKDDYLEAGRALQRFWLTVTHLGLYLQPEAIPIVFARYIREGTKFTVDKEGEAEIRKLEKVVGKLIDARDNGESNTHAFFMVRMGDAKPVQSRSLRQPLKELLIK